MHPPSSVALRPPTEANQPPRSMEARASTRTPSTSGSTNSCVPNTETLFDRSDAELEHASAARRAPRDERPRPREELAQRPAVVAPPKSRTATRALQSGID